MFIIFFVIFLISSSSCACKRLHSPVISCLCPCRISRSWRDVLPLPKVWAGKLFPFRLKRFSAQTHCSGRACRNRTRRQPLFSACRRRHTFVMKSRPPLPLRMHWRKRACYRHGEQFWPRARQRVKGSFAGSGNLHAAICTSPSACLMIRFSIPVRLRLSQEFCWQWLFAGSAIRCGSSGPMIC